MDWSEDDLSRAHDIFERFRNFKFRKMDYALEYALRTDFALVLDLLKTLSWHSGEAISGLMFVLNTPKQTGV